jgi:threonine dehydrogenase-like Zn-dependent dehydrogenase
VTTTNICGSDQHMVRGRTSLPGGHMVLGHEITGEVVEVGTDVEYIKKGDLVLSLCSPSLCTPSIRARPCSDSSSRRPRRCKN